MGLPSPSHAHATAGPRRAAIARCAGAARHTRAVSSCHTATLGLPHTHTHTEREGGREALTAWMGRGERERGEWRGWDET